MITYFYILRLLKYYSNFLNIYNDFYGILFFSNKAMLK